MLLLQVLGISVALSIDAMVVALCWSATCKHVTTKHIFQFAAAFGFFQFLMPLAGGLAGNTVADLVSSWDHWIAFALLAWVSVSMVREAFSEEEEESDLCQVCGTIPWERSGRCRLPQALTHWPSAFRLPWLNSRSSGPRSSLAPSALC